MSRKRTKLNEDPHNIPSRDLSMLDPSYDAYGFGLFNGDMLITPKNLAHGDTYKNYLGKKKVNGRLDRKDFDYPGRFWKGEKVISFWEYPSRSKFWSLLEMLEKEWKEVYPEKEELNFDNSGWEVEIRDGDESRIVSLKNYFPPPDTSSRSSFGHADKILDHEEKKIRSIIRREVKSILKSREILSEIGDASQTYDWREVSKGTTYRFSTQNYSYVVRIKNFGDELHVVFIASNENRQFLNDLTNEGKPLKVISTIIDIVSYIWRNRFEIYNNTDDIGFISFNGFSEDEEIKKKKERLYKKFIRSDFPNARIEEDYNSIKIYPED